ncbi:MAG: WXG100 family type VII secretion target [Anaerovoracaceae bacterium]
MIYVDYSKSRRSARRLGNAADNMRAVNSSISKETQNAALGWKGQSSDAMQVALANWMNETSKIAVSLDRVERQIISVVNELEEAERRLKAQMLAEQAANKGGNSSDGGFR